MMNRRTRIPTLSPLSDAPASVLSRARWDIIVPEETTNLVANPSFEVNTSGWAASGTNTSISRDSTPSAFGVASLLFACTGTNNSDQFAASNPAINIVGGQPYTLSFWYRKTSPADVRGYVGINFMQGVTTLATVGMRMQAGIVSQWTRVVLTGFAPAAATSANIVLVSADGEPTGRTLVVNIDGVQFEAKPYATTYCDGDQEACVWLGAAHGSRSFRRLSKKGGRIMNLASFKFQVAAVVGLGAAAVQPIAMPYAQIGGALYQRTVAPARTFQIGGGWDCESDIELHRSRQALIDALAAQGERDDELTRLIYTLTPNGCSAAEFNTPNERSVVIDAAYAGGLEGAWTSDTGIERATMVFQSYLPFASVGVSPFENVLKVVTATNSLPDINVGVRDMTTGSFVSTGGLTGVVRAVIVGRRGEVYVAGDGVWRLDGAAWTSLGTFNGPVNALAVSPDGDLWAGGTFTTVNGAGMAALARWNGASWAASGATFSPADIRALQFDTRGRLWVGGAFTTVNGAANVYVVVLDGTWQAVFNPLIAVSGGGVNALAQVKANVFYAGGRFDLNAGAGVTSYNIARIITDANSNNVAWRVNNQSFNAAVDAIALAPTGEIYIGGQFTSPASYLAMQSPDITPTFGGTPDQPNYQTPFGSGVNGRVRGLDVRPDGAVIVSGDFSSVGGYSQSGFAEWRSGAWVHPDFEIVGTSGHAFAESVTHQVWSGNFFSSRVARVQEIINPSSSPIYLDVMVDESVSAWMRNIQTWPDRARVMINLPPSLLVTSLRFRAGESPSLIASNGDQRTAIVQGSDVSRIRLMPGLNRVSIYTFPNSPVIQFRWRNQYRSVDAAH